MILSLSHNIHFEAQHIPRVANIAADLLSRLQVPEFLTYAGSSLMCEDLNKTVDVLIRNSLSQSTASAYKATYLNYQSIVTQFFGTTEHPLPPSLRHLTAFIAHCYIKGLAASTTRTFISSLSFIFQLGNYQDISQTFIIKKMLKGFHKSKPTAYPRLPITPEILSSLLHSLEHTTSFFFYQTAS